MKKFCLRHWRGNGSIIPDILKDKYYDYPHHRNKRPYTLAECIVKVLSEKEFKEYVLKRYGQDQLDKFIKKFNL